MRVAVAQNPARLDGTEARLEWLAGVMGGHDLIICPELFACGYHIGDDLYARAEQSGGPATRAMAELARAHGCAVIYGFAEREGKAIFNAAQCIDAHGEVIGRHRKLILPPGFEAGHFHCGNDVALFELGGMTLAMLICYDFEFPEALRHVAGRGAELVAVPTALSVEWPVVAEAMTRTRAFENGIYLAYANAVGAERGMTHAGLSCIIGPQGEELARAGQAPCVIGAEVSKARVAAAQARIPFLEARRGLPF